MIFNCQRKPLMQGLTYYSNYYTHRIEARDEATARVMMFNRSMSRDWLDIVKTDVWSDEDWVAT